MTKATRRAASTLSQIPMFPSSIDTASLVLRIAARWLEPTHPARDLYLVQP
jgi:hypothetical protein